MSEWNKLDFNIGKSATLNTFKKKLLNLLKQYFPYSQPPWNQTLNKIKPKP